jgi:GT2 family glycosyltransferase
MDHRVAVIVATRDRVTSLLRTLDRLLGLPEEPRVVVVDNGSSDGTPERVRRDFPGVQVLARAGNRGAAARTDGALIVDAPYVAFCDDDSWWAPGALALAADLLDVHPALGLVMARILVGREGRLDPTCAAMAASPLVGRPGLPGRAVLGFLACGSVVRRSAFLDVGGFEPRYGVGGEEELLAMDLAATGWDLVYAEEVVAYHQPQVSGARQGRIRVQRRNALWSAWLRRPWSSALGRTARLLADRPHHLVTWLAFAEALRGLPWVLRERRRVPRDVELSLRLLERRPGAN